MTDRILMETKNLYEIELISFHSDMNNYQHMEVYADNIEEAKAYGERLAKYHTDNSGNTWILSETSEVRNHHKI